MPAGAADWLWLDRQWTTGTFALPVIAVALGMLAWYARSCHRYDG